MDKALEIGELDLLSSQKLRGRMQFADSQLFGRIGRLCLRAISDHAYSGRGPKILDSCRLAMVNFAEFLKPSELRRVQRTSKGSWAIYTDACYEPTSSDWACGIGGLLVAPDGTPVQAFSYKLDEVHMEKLGCKLLSSKRSYWRLLLQLSCGPQQYSVVRPSSSLTTTESGTWLYLAVRGLRLQTTCWKFYCRRVECFHLLVVRKSSSPSNPSDGLSRGDLSDLKKWRLQAVSVSDWVNHVMQRIGCK